MIFKVAVLVGLIFVVQAEYEPSQKAKDCLVQVGVDQDTLKHAVTTAGTIGEDDEKMLRFLDCFYGDHISDTNELVVDDKLKTHTSNVFKNILGVGLGDATELATTALDHCKDLKGDTKGKTAIRVVNCLKTKLAEYKKTL